jgi:hypothetical protein
MRNVTVHTILNSMLAILAAALIAAPASGRPPAPGHSAPAAAAGTGWKEMELRYPGSDAVVLYDSLVVTLGSDNHIAKRRHRAVMLFTDNAINRYGDPRILFNAATQDLTVLAARVRMRDGRIAEVRKNGFNQTTPFALDLAPDYVDWQETVVTMMGIEKGCIAELHYLIADKNPSPYLSGVEIFSAEDPTEERVLAVKLPPGMSLAFAPLSGGAPAPDAGTSGTWAWTARDIPGRMPFDGGIWEGDYFPAMCYSTAADWQGLLSKIGTDLAAVSEPVPAAEASILDAVKDCLTNEARALAVHRLAVGAVTGVHAPFTLFAAPARSAGRIYDSGYASALDRAVLLAAMLRTLQFSPKFVLVSAGTTAVGDVPAPELFSRIAVSVPLGSEGELLLDPTAPLEHDPAFSLAGRTLAYLGPAPWLAQLPAKTAADSRSALTLALKPGKDGGFDGKGTAILKGAFSPYYLVQEGENALGDFLKKRVIDFTFMVKLPEKKQGGRVYLAMPRPLESQLSGIERVPAGRSQCVDAIRIEQCQLDVECAIELPEGWKRITDSFSAHEARGIGSVAVSSARTADGELEFRSELQLKTDFLRSESFGDLRTLLQAYGQDRIVLEKE